MFRRPVLLPLLLCMACGTPQPGAVQEPLARDGARLVRDRVVWAPPSSGADGAPLTTLAWEHADGSRTPVDVGPVVHAVVWRGAVVYVDRGLHLWREGEDQPWAEGVPAAPAVSPDGSALAYVVAHEGAEGTHAEVHVRTASADRVVDRSLLAFGALRFSPDGGVLLGVGSVNGGVAGVHAIDLGSGARVCLSNCELRVGQPWGDAFVPPPGDPTALRFEGDELVYDTPAGLARLRWRGGAR